MGIRAQLVVMQVSICLELAQRFEEVVDECVGQNDHQRRDKVENDCFRLADEVEEGLALILVRLLIYNEHY